jgi:hypothetical protein
MMGAGSPTPTMVDETADRAAALAGTSLGLPPGALLKGRAFTQCMVHPQPDGDAPVVGMIMPDSVHTLVGLSPDGWWYEINGGFVPREALQPMTPYEAPPISEVDGFYEVVALLTAVHEYCSPLASIVGRLSFGAVLHVRDRIRDDRNQIWYGVGTGAEHSPFLGWVQAAHLLRWEAPAGPLASEPAIWIDTEQHKLSAYDGERLLGESAIHSPALLPGVGRLIAHAPSMSHTGVVNLGQSAPPGTMRPLVKPWAMAVQPDAGTAVQVYGVYWHNRFGLPHNGLHVELPTFAARWLFGFVTSAAGEVPVIIE